MSGRLYSDWNTWATGQGEFVGPQKQFSQKLQDRGFVSGKRNGSRGFSGIWLKSAEWMRPPATPDDEKVVQMPPLQPITETNADFRIG